MADKSRSIQTKFWEDPWIEGLSPNEKLLYLYLLTNPQTNLLGIYEISLKRISYESGLTEQTVRNGFERFAKDSKAFYNGNFVIIPNFLKNQKLNANMQINVEKIFNQLPKHIKNSIIGNGSQTVLNGYETIRNGLLKLKVKVKGEIESEIESETKNQQADKIHKKNKVRSNVKPFYDKWLEYRKSIKKPIKNADTIALLIKRFNSEDIDKIKWVVNHSIENNYQGLFWDKYKPELSNKSKRTSIGDKKQYEDL